MPILRGAVRIRTRQDVDAWLSGLENFERMPPAGPPEAAYGLIRMRRLLEVLGSPHRRYGIVHVAGTKGKGSTVAMIASILQQGGYRVGRYMSPHVHDLEERICVDDRPIAGADFAKTCRRVARAVDRLTTRDHSSVPTWFEAVTAMAMLYFSTRRVSIAVLETGLGGRLDATNVCDPLVTVITSVSLDHTAQLGRTVRAIAHEKAGIIKPGKPVVSGARVASAARVVASAASATVSPLYLLGRDFHVSIGPTHSSEKGFQRRARGRRGAGGFTSLAGPTLSIDLGSLAGRDETPTVSRLGMAGTHQADNAGLAVAAVRLLAREGFSIDSPAVERGLASVRLPARVELIDARPPVVVDAAHNVASMQSLVDTLITAGLPSGAVLVFSAARDKQVRKMLQSARAIFKTVVLTRFTSNARALDCKSLLMAARRAGFRATHVVEPPLEALAKARSLAGPQGCVCVAGSFFLAGELRRAALQS